MVKENTHLARLDDGRNGLRDRAKKENLNED